MNRNQQGVAAGHGASVAPLLLGAAIILIGTMRGAGREEIA